MKIKIIKKPSKKLQEFQQKEWDQYYGQSYDWTPKKFTLIAYEKKDIVGALEFHIKVGVAEIDTLIIASNNRGQGIGSALFKKAEEIAKKHHVHKLFLITGKGWKAEKFYKGFEMEQTGKLPNHYAKIDFVEYSKFI